LRYYKGFTTNMQGNADDSSDANFDFLNPNNLEKSAYDFPSQNLAAFAENLFYITPKWTVTPGVRWEYIRTSAEGFYKIPFYVGNQLITVEEMPDQKENARSFPLFGIGSSYRFHPDLEVYMNASQNYRSVNFSDLTISNPNLILDSLMQDESGYNLDLGVRGKAWKEQIVFDASLFYLKYNNRIGLGEIIIDDPLIGQKAASYRTNIGDARILGMEAFVEGRQDLLAIKNKKVEGKLFVNAAFIHGQYTSGTSNFMGNNVELIPPFNLKTGLKLNYENFNMTYQFSHTTQHFSDATNATLFPDATRGVIPSYSVHDLSLSYRHQQWLINFNINNLLNTSYFTRRALAYPGPGIIPADGRAFYVNVVYELSIKGKNK